MTEQNNPQAGEQTTPEEKVSEARRQMNVQAGEIAASFDKAKRDLLEAVNRLKKEVDELHVDEAALRARQWISENPILATVLAMGGGLLVGRLLASLLKPAPPPPWPVRARHKTMELATQAQRIAQETGESVARHAGEIVDTLSDQAYKIGKTSSKQAELLSEGIQDTAHRSAEFFENVVDAAKTVAAAILVKKGSDWFRRIF